MTNPLSPSDIEEITDEALVFLIEIVRERVGTRLEAVESGAANNAALSPNLTREVYSALLRAAARIEKLAAFKAYVHERLDGAGIEKEPNGPHSAAGCRVGDRLDIVFAHVSKQGEAIKALEERNKGLEKEIADLELDILRLPAIALDSARAQAIAETREECAKIAEKSAHDHKNGARDAYRKASKLHDLGMMDDADQRTISAQALDCIADEAAAIAAAIRASFPASPSLEPEQS